MSTKKLQILGNLGNKIYTQNDEPVDAVDGSLWIDLDESIGGSSGKSGGYYIPSILQVDENTIEISFTATEDGMVAIPSMTIEIPSGQNGDTPQKGVDYWTDADKTEIIESVLSMLPNGDEVAY